MNVLINTLSNSIILSKSLSKKGMPYFQEFNFSYSLSRYDNKVKALNEILTDDVKKLFDNDPNINLIISDDVVFHGLMSVPTFSFNKSIDAFKTKIKISFPNINDYYIDYAVEEKNDKNTKVVYSLVQTKQSKGLIDVFSHHNITIKNVDYLAHVLSDLKTDKSIYPEVILIIGTEKSEVIVKKGKSILGTSFVNIGSKILLDSSELLLSAYNLENNTSLKYASFHKTNFDSKDLLTDEIILRYPIHESYEISKPREARVIKGASLEVYNKKQNFLKFHSRVLDILDVYKDEPYFVPVNEIKVYSTDEVFESLRAANSLESLKYTKVGENINKFVECSVEYNKLFDSQLVTKERKRIEWSKILTMEIGKKKKA